MVPCQSAQYNPIGKLEPRKFWDYQALGGEYAHDSFWIYGLWLNPPVDIMFYCKKKKQRYIASSHSTRKWNSMHSRTFAARSIICFTDGSKNFSQSSLLEQWKNKSFPWSILLRGWTYPLIEYKPSLIARISTIVVYSKDVNLRLIWWPIQGPWTRNMTLPPHSPAQMSSASKSHLEWRAQRRPPRKPSLAAFPAIWMREQNFGFVFHCWPGVGAH